MLVDQSFILRWVGRKEAPLDDGFAMFVDCVVTDLEARARTQIDGEAAMGQSTAPAPTLHS